MKRFKYVIASLLVGGCLSMVSCSDDEVATSQVTIGLNVTSNDLGNSLTVNTGTYTFTNVSTGQITTIDYASTLTRATVENTLALLTDGLYNVTFTGTGTYTYTTTEPVEDESGETVMTEVTKEGTANIQGAQQNVEVKGGTVSLDLKVYVQNADAQGDFVIAEIFSSGTLNPETNKQYNGDQYIRIYNNSDTTLYADGLLILESEFTTVRKYDYNPNIMDEAFTTQVVAMIPGSGTDYPVAPGEEILICDNAMNHKEANTSSIDLSNADFEWYTESTNVNYPDTDNPDVPNLNMVYNYTRTIWVLTKQGNRAYAIARFPEGLTSEQYLTDYTYTYNYVIPTTGNTSRDITGYKIPNEWIIDAVNLAPKNTYVWNVTSSSLDMGHTYLGENATIAENIGNAVIRKTSYTTDDGRVVLQDTNNSSVDFTPATKASLFSE